MARASQRRPRGFACGHRASIATTLSTAAVPHSVSSTTWPMLRVVSTAYQELTSAMAISGTMACATHRLKRWPVVSAPPLNSSAHCAAKLSSAMVATVRPTSTLDAKESTMTTRGTSNTGRKDR